MKYGMRDITLTKEILGFYYWKGKCDVSGITTEGLVEKGIVSKITPYVVTHTKIDKLTVK